MENNSSKICGVLTMSENTYDSEIILSGGLTDREFAKNLFANLREFDRLGAEVVFAEFECTGGCGPAVRNRLYKAAAQRVIHV